MVKTRRHILVILRRTFTTKQGLIVHLRPVWVSLFAFTLVGLYASIALNVSFLNPVAQAVKEFSLTDIYYQVLSEVPDTSRAITVVDMSKMYTRSEVAALLYEIEAHNPKIVGVDITFQDRRTDLVGNDMLVNIAQDFPNIVFAYYRQDVKNNAEKEVHSFFTDTIPVTEGFTDMPRGLYGVMKRQVPLAGPSRGGLCHSFASAIVNKYADDDLIPLEKRDLNINFESTFSPSCLATLYLSIQSCWKGI